MTHEGSPSWSGTRLEEAEDCTTILGAGLVLTFSRLGDRWTHALGLEGVNVGPLAATVEGDPNRDDPARVVSPSYQEIHEHPVPDGICVLLTGQSTPHHFSAAVTVRRSRDGVSVEFDVADRCRRPIAVLASTYSVALGSSELLDADPERLVWGGGPLGRGQLEFAAGSPQSIALAESGRRACRVQALARIDASRATQRLVYRWSWTPQDGERSTDPLRVLSNPTRACS